MYRLTFIRIIFCLLISLPGKAQQDTLVRFQCIEDASDHSSIWNKSFEMADTIDAIIQQNRYELELNRHGFLSAHVLSDTSFQAIRTIIYQRGPRIHWVRCAPLITPYLSDELSCIWNQEDVFNADIIANKFEKIIEKYSENGYPFASIHLDSVLIDSVSIEAVPVLTTGRMVYWDSLEVNPGSGLNKIFLMNYLDIHPNEIYDEHKISRIVSWIEKLGNVRCVKLPVRIFTGNHCKLYLNIQRIPSNAIQGVLGYAGQQGKSAYLTGDAGIQLDGLGGRGIGFQINYRSFLQHTSDVKAMVQIPFVRGIQSGIDFHFALLKQDTAFIDVQEEIGVSNDRFQSSRIRFFYRNQISTVFQYDTLQLRALRKLPPMHDFQASYLGLSYQQMHLDVPSMPQKGFQFFTEFAMASKTILPNALLREVVWENSKGKSYTIYDSISRNTIQYKLQMQLETYIKTSTHTTLAIISKAAFIEAPTIFISDQFRIGGLKTLRGFDEQSIFTDKYISMMADWRYLIGPKSYFSLYYNIARVRNAINPALDLLTLQGAGGGIQLESGAGILSLFYGVGKWDQNSWNWNASKIHFGYIALF